MRASAGGLSGLLCLALAGLGAAVIFNLHTYQRLSYEQAVAEVRVSQLPNSQRPSQQPANRQAASQVNLQANSLANSQAYQVELRYFNANGQLITQSYPLTGDDWQLDARVLKWTSPATLLGLDANYRLERLSSRYRNLQQAQTTLPTIHGLAEPEQGINLWSLRQDYPEWMPFLDTIYGSGVYMPLVDGAEYTVSISQSGGLLARPSNTEAKQALKAW